jgi:hypothetical protein
VIRHIPVWLLVLDSLATFRLVILVTKDMVFERPRQIISRLGDKAAYFITCPWCTGMYLGAAVIALSRWWGFWPYVAGVLAFSAVAGFLAEYV